MELQGTVAIVTGGNGGLGQRICQALAQAGSHIAVVYTQSQAQAQKVAGQLRQTGVQAEAMACDVTHPQQVQQLVSQVVQTFGRVDILVNDAAYNIWIAFQDLDAMTYEEWQKILDVNLTGPMLCIKAVAPILRQQGHGRIVNIASIAGLMPSGSSIPYAVSKAGLIHLTRCMAVGWHPRCSSIALPLATWKAPELPPTWTSPSRSRPNRARFSSGQRTRMTLPIRW
jgi:3-oxoacyl-[acyl-carrier protein] reductase